jgi:catalase
MSSKDRLTTDYGVKQSTHDDWLKIATKDQTGPLLLEDPFAREKVCVAVIEMPSWLTNMHRS